MKEHIIARVEAGSIGEELNIEVGDKLLQINNQDIIDALDYHLLSADEYIEVLIEKPDGDQWLLEIEKDEDEDLGLIFSSDLMDSYKSCSNKCIFCFIDQLPLGMRDTLYFKDDDSRLSFFQGNYITMTNMKDYDLDRIIKYNMNPINISIHTMDMELRKFMLNNRFAGELKKHMDRLNEHGIIMNGQIVLCKGVNDGDKLEESIKGLEAYLPNMQSVSIVPVGLSKFRKGLYPLEPFTKDDAKHVITLVKKYQDLFLGKYGAHFIHASDEFYLLAEEAYPDEITYDGYLQYENGVGMARLFIKQFDESLQEDTGLANNTELGQIDLVTGTLFAPDMIIMADKFMDKYPNCQINVHPIVNDFFGHRITVSGLLTGQDIIKQLKHKNLGKCLMMPSNLLKSDEPVLLDDISVSDIEKALNINVVISDLDGNTFYKQLAQYAFGN